MAPEVLPKKVDLADQFLSSIKLDFIAKSQTNDPTHREESS